MAAIYGRRPGRPVSPNRRSRTDGPTSPISPASPYDSGAPALDQLRPVSGQVWAGAIPSTIQGPTRP
ncbi:MAG: hypothetical protein LBK54_12955 [Propionibacteriaceae bacterium]|nr:hypothetical protein [Propionibacteriaceae bacterium]